MGTLELNDLVKYGPQLVQKRLDRDTQALFQGKCVEMLYLTKNVFSMCYPVIIVQQTSGSNGVKEDFVRSDDVVEVLGLLHFVPQLIPGTL